MTEPHDPKTDLETDVAWVRRSLNPVLDATPPTETPTAAWSKISDRLDQPGTAPAPAGVRHRRRPQVAMAVAAALALLVGIFAWRASTVDDGGTLTTAPGGPTGFYAPTNLPAGWELTSAWFDDTEACATALRSWGAGDDGVWAGARLSLTYTACDPPIATFASTEAWDGSVSWDGDGHWELQTFGIPEGDVDQVAALVEEDPNRPSVTIGGSDLTLTGASYLGGTGPGPRAAVQLSAPTGELVTYRLSSPGNGPTPDPFTTDEDAAIEDQPLVVDLRSTDEVLRRAPQGEAPTGSSTLTSRRLIGTWPGADLDVPLWTVAVSLADHDEGVRPMEEATMAQAYDLTASLRPATGAEWAAFLDTATSDVDDRLRADTLSDAFGDDVHRTTDTVPADPEEPNTPTTTAPDETPPNPSTPNAPTPGVDPTNIGAGDEPPTWADGTGIVSTPGVVTQTDDSPRSQFADLSKLTVRLLLSSDTVRSGDALDARVLYENPTDEPVSITECTDLAAESGLVPAQRSAEVLPRRMFIDCYATEVAVVPAHGIVRRTLGMGGRDTGMVARRPATGLTSVPFEGALEPGEHRAILLLTDEATRVRVSTPVTVTDPLCSGLTEGDVGAYTDLTVAEAEELAAGRDETVRVVRSDEDSEIAITRDLRCDRIDVDVQAGRITWVDRY